MAELRVMFGEIQATENGSECCAVLEEFDGVDEYDQIDAVCIMLTEDDYDTPEPYDEAMRELFERNEKAAIERYDHLVRLKAMYDGE